jgi:hypothetical protein
MNGLYIYTYLSTYMGAYGVAPHVADTGSLIVWHGSERFDDSTKPSLNKSITLQDHSRGSSSNDQPLAIRKRGRQRCIQTTNTSTRIVGSISQSLRLSVPPLGLHLVTPVLVTKRLFQTQRSIDYVPNGPRTTALPLSFGRLRSRCHYHDLNLYEIPRASF